ncbi:MAG: ATP-binding protein [Bacteroidetes bacterium]|nr:MAG: ATP-binding protein [Bacteroidota bacterium]
MQAILFCGLQATGKSSFFKERFFHTHLRISLDLLKTRNRENLLLEYCLSTQMPFVVDNTNPTVKERELYIGRAKQKSYRVVGYYFQSKLVDALQRNATREGKQRIPDAGLRGTYSKLETPSFDEGFDELYYVELKNNEFIISDWSNEV